METISSKTQTIINNIAEMIELNVNNIKDDWFKFIDNFRKSTYENPIYPYFIIGTKNNKQYHCYTGQKWSKDETINLTFNYRNSKLLKITIMVRNSKSIFNNITDFGDKLFEATKYIHF